MSLSAEDKKLIRDQIKQIEGVSYGGGIQDNEAKDNKHYVSIYDDKYDDEKSIIDNPAIHDFYRLEFGAPVITQDVVDGKLTNRMERLFDSIGDIRQSQRIFKSPLLGNLFQPATSAVTSTPASSSDLVSMSEAEQVEEMLVEIKADLRSISAGPIPSSVQSFVHDALSELLDQNVWAVMSPSQRERLGQLANSWQKLMNPATETRGGQGGSGGTPGLPGGGRMPGIPGGGGNSPGFGGGVGSGLPSVGSVGTPGSSGSVGGLPGLIAPFGSPFGWTGPGDFNDFINDPVSGVGEIAGDFATGLSNTVGNIGEELEKFGEGLENTVDDVGEFLEGIIDIDIRF